MKPKTVTKAQASVTEWLRKTAAELHAECPDQPSKDHKPYGHKGIRKETVDGIEVQLYREIGWWTDKAKGRLFPARFAPPDHEALRVERLTKAMNKKLPKLAAWKKEGARSVLVLEDRDIVLSNHALILDAARKGARRQTRLSGRSLARRHHNRETMDRLVPRPGRGFVSR
jgi:hypothetical protein